jgi:hypothetical protein
VYLSNYLRDNTAKTKALYAGVLTYFKGMELSKQEIMR